MPWCNYRGYDSAGLAVRDGELPVQVVKAKGRLKVLDEKTDGGAALYGTCGIGHTRWATHGEPSENNAHPHISDDGNVTGVHNGIIENYQELKDKLVRKGYTFYSSTDTEVAIKLIDYYYKKYEGTPVDAINHAMVRIRGSYALAVMFQAYPDEIYVARKDSPMILGVEDGASYIDASGKTIWTQSYEMKTPIININGDYAVIADQQGNEMYICSKEGCTGTAKTQLPITKAAVSARGVTAAVVEDSTASYIFYFKKDGESLGINIKMLLSGDGYPVDIALSPDGKQIVMSVMYMKNGALKNKVAFYDFSEIGKNVNNRFIAAFEEEFDDKMVGRIRYLNDQTVCAFSDKGLTFISVKNVIPDTNVTFVPVDEEIQSICYSDKYAAVVVDSTSGSPYRLDVYNTDGKKVTSIDFDYAYTGVLIDGDRLILYNEESCREYNLDGHERFNGQFDFSVSLVRAGKNRTNSLITAGSEVMKEIKLR